ncbi:AAA family ATPase [Streptomyces sp. NBC_01795]|uniref:HelD family protein n=1 Tax=unclassified Streptomyces TaxID=2593676 RepID=UPI002DDA0861|nr:MULTISPECIES: AAA family ATPase [unclassified Streptomyces]WSA91037.1 AAA family ATPase [Streptomyces sp. NBC_01795]WSS16356.1 AAA family ATPase [Streptomyces sp. NBC_01186]
MTGEHTTGDDGGSPHGELAAERAYTALCGAALDRMSELAQGRVLEGAGILTGRHSGESAGEGVAGDGASAEALGRHLRSRAKEWREEPQGPPFFGRLDFECEGAGGDEAGEHRGQRYYIGRRRVCEHPASPPLVLDWRAPVSRAFYQASALHPQGVRMRRRFGWAPGSPGTAGDLTGMEDEPLADAHSAPEPVRASRIVAGEIERPRVGPMRDIVATIQPEQDELVRSGPEDSVCVQGAPGTGKTAVGLHRAAYLLYTHPRRFERGGMLVVGPNSAFLGYISEVLPSLGEAGVRQCRVDDLLPGRPVRAADSPEAVEVKHGAAMAAVLRRALYSRVRLPDAPLAVPDGSYRWRLPEEDLRAVVEETLAQAPPYGVGRERVRARTVALLRSQAERRAGPPDGAWLRRMGRTKALTGFLDAVWPRAKPEEVLIQLLGSSAALEAASEGLLSPREREALLWSARRPRSPRAAQWSPADLLLLDEVAGLIAHPEESYAHVVVDEAQDLSPMQCRVLARRSRFGSLTVLGDLAQGTTPWAARDWSAQLAHLGAPGASVVPLTTGFRVPAVLVEAANRLLDSLEVRVPPSRSLRRDGELTTLRVPGDSALARAVTERVRAALDGEGSVAVIADRKRVEPLLSALHSAGLAAGGPEDGGGGGGALGRVAVLPADLAKGLEYDHVVLAEPAQIAESGPRGLELLYVVLTRAVSRLDILHARELPEAMAG